jgi:hypothetical protein
MMGRDATENRELLISALEDQVDRLRAEDERVSQEVDWPSLASVMKKASILTEDDARRVTRSHAEARATFHRASKDLIPALERDQESHLAEPTTGEGEHADDQAEGEGESTAVTEADGPADEPAAVVVEEGAALEAGGDPAERLGPEAQGDALPGSDQPTRSWFEVVPMSACRREGWRSQNEPENRVDASAQVVEKPMSSVDLGPAAPSPQNGVLSGAPALPETPRGPASSPGGAAGPGAARTNTYYSAVGRHQPASKTAPLRSVTGGTPARGEDSRNEPENRTVTSAQSVVAKTSSVADRPAEPGRQRGVPNAARTPAAGNPKSETRNKAPRF